MIVQLVNGSAFRIDQVRAWDRGLEPPNHLRVHLADGVRFEVHPSDVPTPNEVEAYLCNHFSPIADFGPSYRAARLQAVDRWAAAAPEKT